MQNTEKANSIISKCDKLNDLIHHPLYHNFYNISDELKYNQTFTSIDLIEDSQIAIDEFENAKSLGEKGRSTLLIYGLLQSLYLQQEGLYHLYKCVVENKISIIDFFDLFGFDKKIREVRNDIAGHPTNRKSNEFYFIAKGAMSKYKFTYAGYTPDFRTVDVDLKLFIQSQLNFAESVLQTVEDNINTKIKMKKEEHKDVNLKEMIIGASRNQQLIYRGIRDSRRSFQGEWGITGITSSICEIRSELNLRYNSNLPIGFEDTLRLIDYILLRFNQWLSEGNLFGNDDAEIFLDSLSKQLDELEEMLEETDDQFN